ncbi:hypothetical protein JZ751_004982 [Albula glossodonta]|uniref:Peptidase M20 domain-containing protein 2 n=1 Tax=Albula glossodonta TaxID=121402 RepID=A0A8T2P4C6_9TELE|nr:hypothetical protein JZ751_004982 [Albula glossodonta]
MAAPASSLPFQLQQWKQRAGDCIEEAKDKLYALSKFIWSCPELAYEENQSHDRLVRFFTEERGWTVESHYKLETAFRATWGPVGGKEGDAVVSVGFLCEYDALPGIGHACGHNLIAEVGAAGALGLKGVLETISDCPIRIKCFRVEIFVVYPDRAKTVTVLGTPAEEDGGGKIDMILAGAFEGMDVVFMAHPSQEDAPYLPDVAEHDVTVKYHGKASHAAAYPWEGINALDAAVLAYNNLSVLRQQLKPDWRLHGIIKHGGVKPNIIPAYTELEFYLRTPMRRDLPAIRSKAEMCFRSAAMATGCQVEVQFAKHEFHNILRNTTLDGLYKENGQALGIEFTTDQTVLTTSSGAEKAQFYTLRTAKALAMTALDVLFCPGVLQRVRAEFTEARLKEERGRKSRESEDGSQPKHCGGAAALH